MVSANFDRVFQDVIYSGKPTFGDVFMRLPEHVSILSLDASERIRLIDSQERQYLEKRQSWSYKQEVRLLLKAPYCLQRRRICVGMPLVFWCLVW